MKKITLVSAICLLGTVSFAQSGHRAPTKETKKRDPVMRPNKCPALYTTFSAGLNNNTGALGFNFEVPIEKYIAADIGAGISTWGTKVYVGGKYYLDPCQHGWAFGTGITYNTGLTGFQKNMATIHGNELVTLNLHSQTNVLFAAYRYWNLGKRYNRVYIELGWSVPLNATSKYDVIKGDPLTNESDVAVRLVSPGGLIAGVGISFGVH